MAEVSPSRAVALAVVSRARRRDAYARELLRAAPEMARLSLKARGLASRLVLGSTACRGLLDAVLDSHLRRPRDLEPRVRDALRVACFEVMYLETSPEVSVFQGVELVRTVARRASGLANAVLRKVVSCDRPRVRSARERVTVALAGGVPVSVADVSLVAGMPSWLAVRLCASLPAPQAAAMALAQLEPAPAWVAANTGVCDAAQAYTRLRESGTAPVPVALPGSFLLEKPAALARSGLVGSVDVVVSDLGSQMVSRIGAPAPGTALLEVGQGRATKTILLENAAAALGGPAKVVAVDLSESKVELARERVSHGWEASVTSMAWDARLLDGPGLPRELDRSFDTVFCDVPCSGTGTMRRHPEIPWALDPSALDADNPDGLPALQGRILEAASRRVAPGGTLVYATCSVLDEEGPAVVDRFLDSPAGRGFRREDCGRAPGVAAAPVPFQGMVRRWVLPSGDFASVPATDGPDGHFAARLVRRG